MSRKYFIALANCIRQFQLHDGNPWGLTENEYRVRQLTIDDLIETLADFCKQQNPNFNRQQWIDYIHNHPSPNKGKLPHQQALTTHQHTF